MATPIYVPSDDPLFFSISYQDHGDPVLRTALQAQWQNLDRFDPATGKTYKLWVRPSSSELEVVVDRLLPPGVEAGRYRIETFIPGRHATSRRAVFTVTSELRITEQGAIELSETLAVVDMLDLQDVWFSLGEFYLDPQKHPLLGRVRQYDLSREDPPTEISFGPVRWVPLASHLSGQARYDSPVGTPEERQGDFPTGRVMFGRYPAWAGEWFDVNPFLSWYTYGCHTGADLNLPGVSSADRGKPIFTISDGLVIYAGAAGTWGNIIVIEHPDALVTHPDGHTERQMVYSRYGHVEDHILVRAGQIVNRGDQVGAIGLAKGATAGWHLHFDICYTDLLKKRPSAWPNLDGVRGQAGRYRNSDGYLRAQAGVRKQVLDHYVDPLRFIQDNHGE